MNAENDRAGFGQADQGLAFAAQVACGVAFLARAASVHAARLKQGGICIVQCIKPPQWAIHLNAIKQALNALCDLIVIGINRVMNANQTPA